jgi:hypothetical protein
VLLLELVAVQSMEWHRLGARLDEPRARAAGRERQQVQGLRAVLTKARVQRRVQRARLILLLMMMTRMRLCMGARPIIRMRQEAAPHTMCTTKQTTTTKTKVEERMLYRCLMVRGLGMHIHIHMANTLAGARTRHAIATQGGGIIMVMMITRRTRKT